MTTLTKPTTNNVCNTNNNNIQLETNKLSNSILIGGRRITLAEFQKVVIQNFQIALDKPHLKMIRSKNLDSNKIYSLSNIKMLYDYMNQKNVTYTQTYFRSLIFAELIGLFRAEAIGFVKDKQILNFVKILNNNFTFSKALELNLLEKYILDSSNLKYDLFVNQINGLASLETFACSSLVNLADIVSALTCENFQQNIDCFDPVKMNEQRKHSFTAKVCSNIRLLCEESRLVNPKSEFFSSVLASIPYCHGSVREIVHNFKSAVLTDLNSVPILFCRNLRKNESEKFSIDINLTFQMRLNSFIMNSNNLSSNISLLAQGSFHRIKMVVTKLAKQNENFIIQRDNNENSFGIEKFLSQIQNFLINSELEELSEMQNICHHNSGNKEYLFSCAMKSVLSLRKIIQKTNILLLFESSLNSTDLYLQQICKRKDVERQQIDKEEKARKHQLKKGNENKNINISDKKREEQRLKRLQTLERRAKLGLGKQISIFYHKYFLEKSTNFSKNSHCFVDQIFNIFSTSNLSNGLKPNDFNTEINGTLEFTSENDFIIGLEKLFDYTRKHSFEHFNLYNPQFLEELLDLVEARKTFRAPRIPKGTRDSSPEMIIVREKVFAIIKSVFHRHGAVGIDTPVFELRDTLTGKYGEDSKLIYDLADQGGEALSLRYDLTVPFARYVAMNRSSGSIKRYHIAKVQRRDQPSIKSGKFREFYQCDYDIAGSGFDSMIPDADVISVVCEILQKLNLGYKFIVKINHRSLLDVIMLVAGVPSVKFRSICSAIDKLDKVSQSQVRDEMINEKGLSEKIADEIYKYIILNGHPFEVLKVLRQDIKFGDLIQNSSGKRALEEMNLLFEFLSNFGCLDLLCFDLSLARGLDYYTGIIYEAILLDTNGKALGGSIAGGGRYDHLVGMFSHKEIPAVGVSIGIERLLAIMQENSKIGKLKDVKEKNIKNEKCEKARKNHTQVVVASNKKGMLKERMQICSKLQSHGIAAEFLYKNNPQPDDQIAFTLDMGCPLMIFLNPEDYENKKIVELKDLKRKEKITIKVDEIIEEVKLKLN